MREGFDALVERKRIVEWIRNFVDGINPNAHVVIGISGGKDSTVTAALLKESLGEDRVIGVMMPNGMQSDIADSYAVINALKIRSMEINIQTAYQGVYNQIERTFGYVSEDARINIAPRIRMTTLYAVAQSFPKGGFVVNTCNKSEDFVGYSTKFGDSAGDFSPLANYLVSEVIAIGDTYEEIPKRLIHKAPSDGLCGQTDEDKLGFKYDDVEEVVATKTHHDEEIFKKIMKKHWANLHKLEPMPSVPFGN